MQAPVSRAAQLTAILLIAAKLKIVLKRVSRGAAAHTPLLPLLCPRPLGTPRRIAAGRQPSSGRCWARCCLPLLILPLVILSLQSSQCSRSPAEQRLCQAGSPNSAPRLPGWIEQGTAPAAWPRACILRRRCASSASSRCRSSSASSSAARIERMHRQSSASTPATTTPPPPAPPRAPHPFTHRSACAPRAWPWPQTPAPGSAHQRPGPPCCPPCCPCRRQAQVQPGSRGQTLHQPPWHGSWHAAPQIEMSVSRAALRASWLSNYFKSKRSAMPLLRHSSVGGLPVAGQPCALTASLPSCASVPAAPCLP